MTNTDTIFDKIISRDKAIGKKIDEYIESLRPKVVKTYHENGLEIKVYESR